MYLSSGWHFGAHHIFFFSQAHPDRKHLNSERTSAVIPHSSILSFSRSQNPVILQYISLWLRKACRMKKKAKKWVSSNLCHALVPLSALRPVCTREQQKPPLENDVWKQAKFLGQLNSAQVKKSLCWKQFTSSLWGLAAAQRKVQGDCSISLYILHLASSKSSGEKKKVIYIRFWLLRTYAWRDTLTASHSWFLHEVRAALVDEESLFCI